MHKTHCLSSTAIPSIFAFASLLGCGSDNTSLFDPVAPLDGGSSDVARDGASATPDAHGSVESSLADQANLMPDVGRSETAEGRDGSANPDTSPMNAHDAPTTSGDADAGNTDALCMRECEGKGIGTCAFGECIIRCDDMHPCNARVLCPPGMPCHVSCISKDSCGAGVDCTLATKCDISCSGVQSCGGIVQCSGASCVVNCLELSTCSKLVSCGADRCELTCSGSGSCATGVVCTGTPSLCNIGCTGPVACKGGIEGRGNSELRCTGSGSCPSTVACSGQKCTILCNPHESCGGAVCCQAATCDYQGTDRRCL
jgi:hypothetical protein